MNILEFLTCRYADLSKCSYSQKHGASWVRGGCIAQLVLKNSVHWKFSRKHYSSQIFVRCNFANFQCVWKIVIFYISSNIPLGNTRIWFLTNVDLALIHVSWDVCKQKFSLTCLRTRFLQLYWALVLILSKAHVVIFCSCVYWKHVFVSVCIVNIWYIMQVFCKLLWQCGG
jgi:hypothetical protein